VDDGAEVVIVGGGDGTINEAAQGLVGTGASLAVWPCGTANVLARELRLPGDEKALSKLIAAQSLRTISVGRAMKPETGWQRYFLLMAGIGLDAAIVDRVDLGLKRLTGIGAYLASGLSFLARLPLTPFSIEFNGQKLESAFTVISNAANYAAWFTLAPGARLDDDKLDVCVFNSRSRLAYLTYAFLSLAGGSHTRSSNVVYQPAREAKANSNDAALVQLDGEVVGNLPMKFEIVPGALRVIAPVSQG
jgi:YegS/Rv2252/BmrU family lipid kinase